MRRRFLLWYVFRTAFRFALVLLTWSVYALRVGFANLKAFISTAIAYTLAILYSVITGYSLQFSLILVSRYWGIEYTNITAELLVNTFMPTLWTFLVFIGFVYALRYVYTSELSHAYAAIALTTVAILVGILAGHHLRYSPVLLVLVLLAEISAVHTYYYAVNMLEPYFERLVRIDNVLQKGHTHVPLERLRRYVQEMRRKDPGFRDRLTLSREISKLSRVAMAAMIGSILNIALAMTIAYVAYYLSSLIFEMSLYESIAKAVEIGQPELFLVFVGRIASAFYLYSLRISGLLKET